MTRRPRDDGPAHPLAPVLALLALAACGTPADPPTRLYPVHGQVRRDGRPLRSGTITFYPAGPGQIASGEIRDGDYQLSTTTPGDGARPGPYRVAVTVGDERLPRVEVPAGVAGPGAEAAPSAIARPAVPESYADPNRSGLSADVGPRRNAITFDLDRGGDEVEASSP